MIQSTAAVAAATAGTSIAHQYTVSTPSSLLPSPSSPGNNGVNHPLHPQQLQLQLQQQQRQSYTRSLSSSPSGPAEAEGGGGGGGPIPVIEFPDDEVHFYPFLLHPTSPTIPFFFHVFIYIRETTPFDRYNSGVSNTNQVAFAFVLAFFLLIFRVE